MKQMKSLKPARTTLSAHCAAGAMVLMLGLTACGDKAAKPGQALARVNGQEITVLQLNEELQRANVQPQQQEQASKQMLASLVDRQLLLNAANEEKLDRDPKVVQAIERAKAVILAQSYLQKKVGTLARPSKEEVADYYAKHPVFFANNKQIDMRQLLIASRDMTPELKAAMDSAKSLEEVAGWLDSHKVKFARAQLTRSTAELPPELSGKLLGMPKGQLFIVREGERTLLISLADVRDTPVGLEAATPQIEQFLFNQKNKEVATAELSRLRAAAKIEYFNKTTGQPEPAPAAEPAAPARGAPGAPAAAPAAAPATEGDATARGVAGLK